VALKDGTMAWLHAGLELQRDVGDALPEPSDATLAESRRLAEGLAQRVELRHITTQELARFEAEGAERSLYLLDIRSKDEYKGGHLPGWRWAPGGQLLQATDQYVGTRRARVVLADWDGVRALVTGAWLAQLDHSEVYLYRPEADAELEIGPAPTRVLRHPAGDARWLSPHQLQARLKAGPVAIYDVDSSLAFATRHIADARFAAPDRLPEFLVDVPNSTPVVITSSDGRLAGTVAAELASRHGRDAWALRGGNAAWFALGLPTGNGRGSILTNDDDDWYSPYAYETAEERLAKMREYLDWETALADQIVRDGDVRIQLTR
jgi:rhodanese-related sulfurtransferase